MDLPALPSDQEVFSLSANEFRFRQACYFLQMFRRSCGVQVPLGSRFLWVTYADTFLMAVASLRDVDAPSIRLTLRRVTYSASSR